MARTIAEVARDRMAHSLVGRRRELDALAGELLDGDRFYVAHVHGVPGIGKSSLLSAFADRARASGADVVLLDGRSVEPTQRGFEQALARALEADDHAHALGELLGQSGPRLVILVDQYEVLRLLDTWLRQEFVPKLPESVRIVLAGREAPVAGWMASRDVGDAVMFMVLEPLGREEAIELLRQQGVSESSAAEVAVIAHGHPLALKLAAASVAERPHLAPRDVAGQRVLEELTRLYLADVRDPTTLTVLEAASVIRRTTSSLIAGLVDDVAPHEAIERLRTLPFVEVGPDGLIIHEAIQAQVSGYLRASDPVRHRQLRRAAWHVLRGEVRSAGPEQLWRYTADMLYLIENPVVREAFFPSGAQPLAVEPAKASDLPSIELISRRHDGEAGWRLMEAWWRTQPGAFSVVRDRDGSVRGFHCLLEQSLLMPPRVDDPVVNGWWQQVQGNPPPHGQTILGYRRWLDIEYGEAPCSTQAASWLDVKRTYMVLRPHLRRMFTVVEDPEPYLQVVLKLGFRPFDEGGASVGERHYTSVALDFGPDSVDGWLAALVADELGLAPAVELDAGSREVRIHGSNVQLTELELGVLRCLQQREGRAVTRATMLEEVWGYRDDVGSNVVDAVVRRLRDKLGHDQIQTVRGSGYRLTVH